MDELIKQLPRDISVQVYTFDATYKNKYKLVVRSIKRLPKFERTLVQPENLKQSIEFTFRTRTYRYRRSHIFCTYSCYLRNLFFYSKHKPNLNRLVYLETKMSTSHELICNEWKNTEPINIFTNTKQNELL